MRSAQERVAQREARELERLTSGMAGRTTDDLRLAGSPVSKQLDWFKAHPANSVFDVAKSPRYWRDLERDIREAGRIIDPVVALPDGTLVEGHSRITIARKLAAAGVDLGRIPTVILDLSAEEAERRVYLGNLSRFELDVDTRLALYLKVWPDYYLEARAGRPKKGDTVSPFSERSGVARREEIAAATGRSERQVKRDRAVIRDAVELARSEGKTAPGVEEIRSARETASKKRREGGSVARPPAQEAYTTAPIVVVELTSEEVDEIVRVLSENPSPSERSRRIVEKLMSAPRTQWKA